MHAFNAFIIILVVIGCASSKAVVQATDEPAAEEPHPLVGTWVVEGGSYGHRWVYYSNNTVKRYYKNKLYKTYHWTIEEGETPSGLLLKDLILINVNDPEDKLSYAIHTLTDSILELEYTSLGVSVSIYHKQ